jgi:GTP-binding protein
MVDKVEILVKGGDGGDGIVSFRREKFVPFGGPDGGDGGRGGNVVIAGDLRLSTLGWFSGKRMFRAKNGGRGAGNRRHGKRGQDLELSVPVGTLIFRKERDGSELPVADIATQGQRVVVGRGGCGGFGNAHFATATQQAPRFAQRGEAGEELAVTLDLKLIAAVGIIGYPSVGKSTLLASASAARPKVADYPFTTQEPVLGVVEVGYRSFVMAEIPGLIEGAHRGLGLGHDFLRHIERTQVLIHLLDGCSQVPVADMRGVNEELALFKADLARKPQLLVVNKIDLPQVRDRMAELTGELASLDAPLFLISAATGEGVPQLMAAVAGTLDAIVEEENVDESPQQVFCPQPKFDMVAVYHEGDIFTVSAPKLERIVAMTDLTDSQARRYLKRQLSRLGVTRALRKAGVKAGDRVRFGEVEMEWE